MVHYYHENEVGKYYCSVIDVIDGSLLGSLSSFGCCGRDSDTPEIRAAIQNAATQAIMRP